MSQISEHERLVMLGFRNTWSAAGWWSEIEFDELSFQMDPNRKFMAAIFSPIDKNRMLLNPDDEVPYHGYVRNTLNWVYAPTVGKAVFDALTFAQGYYSYMAVPREPEDLQRLISDSVGLLIP